MSDTEARCALCHEPVHLNQGVLVHDFSGRETCTYRSHL